jgi:hypothetical protein
VFRSFFLAGFECATGLNAEGAWIDQIAATQHDRFADEDYRRVREVGIRAVREGVRWPLVDRRGRFAFETLRPFLRAARRHGLDVIWDLFHFGYPLDLDLFAPAFPERFAEYCYAAARYVGSESEGPLWFTPVNEPSYFAWAAGDASLFAPHAQGRGFELKLQLARAGLRGAEALRAAAPGARILSVDAICRVVAPPERPELEVEVESFNRDVVFQSFDLLAGRIHPELGGSREALDVIGVNYYWTNQWELGRPHVPLPRSDPRRAPLREIVSGVWERYGGELLISETGHLDAERAPWLLHVAEEAEGLLAGGVPLRGVCLYPILGMPEWHARERWARMGLWDLVPRSPTLGRRLHRPMLDALRVAQRLESRSRNGACTAPVGRSG